MNIRKLLLAATIVFLWSGQAAQAEEDTSPTSIEGLPLVEVPANGQPTQLAIFYSGDGGWAQLDKGVSARLAASGTRVIGMSSLRYLWRERTPDEAAADLARVLRFYLAEMKPATSVILVGYSTGADIMPFLVNRLPDLLRARVASVTLIAPGHDAEFVIHVADWLPGRATSGKPVLPEIERLGVPVLCLYGEGDTSTLCPELPADRGTTVLIGKGHHLGGMYDAIAQRILSFTAKAER